MQRDDGAAKDAFQNTGAYRGVLLLVLLEECHYIHKHSLMLYV